MGWVDASVYVRVGGRQWWVGASEGGCRVKGAGERDPSRHRRPPTLTQAHGPTSIPALWRVEQNRLASRVARGASKSSTSCSAAPTLQELTPHNRPPQAEQQAACPWKSALVRCPLSSFSRCRVCARA